MILTYPTLLSFCSRMGSVSREIKIRDHRYNISGHSVFTTFDEMERETQSRMVSNRTSNETKVQANVPKILHYGWGFHRFRAPLGKEISFVGNHLNELWSIFGNASGINQDARAVVGRRGAVFAVHKERIRANSKYVYEQLQSVQLSERGETARKRCMALEFSWHALFGEPARLPKTSTIDDLYIGHTNYAMT